LTVLITFPSGLEGHLKLSPNSKTGAIRRALKLKPGDVLRVRLEHGKIIFERKRRRERR